MINYSSIFKKPINRKMKKIILGAALMLSGGFLVAQTAPAAKNKMAEGVITYAVEWTLPEKMQGMADNFPKELKVYFKGDSSSMKMESQMYSSTVIMNAPKQYERMLMDIPVMGKKFSVLFTPADQDKMEEKMPQLSLKGGTETKTILGYKAVKFDVNEKKSNQSFEAWFTKDVDIVSNNLSRFYDKNYGFPLDFKSFLNGITLKATVKNIEESAVPAGVFTASKDYEEITFDHLMQMSGGR